MSFAYVVTWLTLWYRVGVFAFLIGYGVLDIHFFTYINYTLVTLAYALWLYFMRRDFTYTMFSNYVLPMIWGTTLTVAVVIVVIVDMNEDIFLRSSKYNGGTRSIGKLHTGDFFVHFAPVFDLLLNIVVQMPYLKAHFQSEFRQMNLYDRIIQIVHFMFSPIVILVIYMLNFDFHKNYPTSLPPAATITLVVFVSLCIQAFLLVALVTGEHDPKKTDLTPIHKWTKYL